MDDPQEETDCLVITDGFVRALLPFFSWYVSQLSWAMLGCKLTLVLRHPTDAYKRLVRDSWVEGNFLFSCAEILSFATASGRRRARKKLKKIFAPFFRELSRRPEAIFVRHTLQAKLQSKMPDGCPSIPRRTRMELDLGEIEERRIRDFSSYSREDILETFTIEETVPPSLTARIESEVGDHPETIRSFLWETSHDWSLIRQVTVKKNSKVWALLGIDPDNEPDMEQLIDMSLDFALGQADANKLVHLVRWVMGRMIMSQFSLHPYSEKHFTSLGKPIGDDLTLKDTVADGRAQDFVDDIETVKADTPWAQPTDLSQAEGREAIIEALARKGIGYNDLTPKEWDEIFEKRDLIRNGYEFSSKTGVSIGSFYGKAAHAKEQKWSRIKKKIRELSE
jgi:hypothetical protein